MMNKILLTKFIREEIKNVREQSKNIMTDFGPLDVPDMSAAMSPEQKIERMADALDVNVSVHLGAGYNKLTFRQRDDVDEKTFEQMIQFLERIGYNVDLGQSDRMYDFEPGERHYYPQIRF